MSAAQATCPACSCQRLHTDEERKQWHKMAGHGYTAETGWTHPAAEAAHDAEVIAAAARIKAELDARQAVAL